MKMDEIQRKLALIDNQLSGRTLRGRLVSTAPLFLPALGLMAGILLQSRLAAPSTGSPRSVLSWIWLVAAGPVGAVLLAARIRSRLRPEEFALVASFCFLCLGVIRLLTFETPAPADIRRFVRTERVLATVRGRILTQPYQQPQNWCFARFTSADPPTAFYLETEALQTAHGWQPAEGTIRVRVDEPAPNLEIGNSIEAYCWLHRYEEPTNPGQFNVAEYLRLRNIHVGASVPAREAITVLDGPGNILTDLRRVFTTTAAKGLLDHPPSDTRGEAILEALLLGDRRNIDPETYEAFRRTGLLHLVSLSGMHLGILIAIVWWFGKLAGLMKRGRAMVCVVATVVFLLVVPVRPPTLRATVIVWTLCASILLRRRPNPLNSLSLAAIILLLMQPTQLFDIGWQLSFAATAGILAFTGPITEWLLARTHGRLESSGWEPWSVLRALKAMANWTIRALAVGIAAWLGSAGILLYHFYNITPLASVWTVIAALPVTLILTLGFLKIVLSFFLPTLSMLLGGVLHLLADLLIGMVRLMAEVDLSYILIGRTPWTLIALYYALILFAAFVHLRRPIVKKALCTAMLLMLLVPLGVMKWQRTHRSHLSITCLDVGHGQAILARLPGTMNVLFDVGSLFSSDIGTRVVVPFLDYEGIGRLHAVVVSHRDIDHINGVPEVVNRRPVGCVYFDEMSFAHSQDVETVQALMSHLAGRRVPANLMPGTIDAGHAQIRLLWPTAEAVAREQLSDNDKSLVCLIEYADRRALLCSDIESLAQREIMTLYPALKADVVVVPHHGSVRTLDSRLLDQLSPSVLLCSCSSRDYEQGRVMKAFASGKLLITAPNGAVNVCIDDAGMVETSGWTQH